MSSDVKEAITGTTLKQIVLKFFSQQFLKNVDFSKLGFNESKVLTDGGVGLIQTLIDDSNSDLKIYKTTEVFADQIHLFRNLTSSHKSTRTDIRDDYEMKMKPYSNEKGEQFVCKQEIFNEFRKEMLSRFPAKPNPLISSMLVLYFERFEEEIDGCCEFAKYDPDFRTKLKKSFKESSVSKGVTHFLGPPVPTFDVILKEWKSLFPNNMNKEQNDAIRDNINAHFKPCPEKEFVLFNSTTLTNFNYYSKLIDTTINTNRHMFLPDPQNPAVVRVFEDENKHRFVMRCELFDAVNKTIGHNKPYKYKDDVGFWRTMSMDAVNKRFGHLKNSIEFITIPIERVDHVPIPIMTPTGGDCILAFDAFTRIVRQLVLRKILQKVKEIDPIYNYVQILIRELKMEMKCRYFVSVEKMEKLEIQMQKYFKEYEDQPTKIIRNVGNDGFNTEFLREELKLLGLSDSFPVIVRGVESSYELISSGIPVKELKTFQLYQAVDKCQFMFFISFIKHYALAFYTNQTYHDTFQGHQRIDYKHTGTVWNEYESSDVALVMEKQTLDSHLLLPDGMKINFQTFKFPMGKPKCYTKNNTVFIRTFTTSPSTEQHSNETRRMFAMEAWDVFAGLQSETFQHRATDDIIDMYERNWAMEHQFLSTISLAEFEQFLEDFDIDKNQITIVPDPFFVHYEVEMIRSTGTQPLTFFNSDDRLVLTSSQTIFHIFQSIVCSVNWKARRSEEEGNRMKELKELIIKKMQTVATMNKRLCIARIDIEYYISSVKSRWELERKEEGVQKFQNTKFDDLVTFKLPGNDVELTCERFRARYQLMGAWVEMFFGDEYAELKKIVTSELRFKNSVVKVIDNQKKTCSTKDLVCKKEGSATEKEECKKCEELLKVSAKVRAHYAENKELSDKTIEEMKEQIETLKTLENNKSEVLLKNKAEIKELNSTVANLSNDLQNYESLKSKYKEDKEKWESSSKKLTDSKNQLTKKVTQMENQMKQEKQKTQRFEAEGQEMKEKYEKEVVEKEKVLKMEQESGRKINQLEFQIKQERQKIQKCEQDVERQKSDSIRDNERMKQDMEKLNSDVLAYREKVQLDSAVKKSLEEEVEKNRRLVEEMTEALNQMTSRNRQLESLLEREKEKTQELAKGAILQLQRLSGDRPDVNLEEEILEKDRIINELRQTNFQQTGQIEQQNMMIKGFFNHFGQIKTEFSSAETQTETPGSEIGYTGTRHSLLRLQKIKDTFWNGNQIKTAKEMMQKLISMSNRCEIHQFANYELQQFETNIHNYVQEVERNIQKMKRTNDPMEMTSLPQPPSLSDRFMNEYWNEIDKEIDKRKDSSGTLTDSECLICFEEMKQEEKTLKCNECKKETHMNCASQWLSVHRSCPHCRKELLDPDEFPPLS